LVGIVREGFSPGLRRILAGRSAFYSKADMTLDTSRQPLDQTFQLLRAMASDVIGETA